LEGHPAPGIPVRKKKKGHPGHRYLGIGEAIAIWRLLKRVIVIVAVGLLESSKRGA